ncbi:MAG: FUSC family protein [Chitinophagaceae bacterium]|nr:FUSC family protein [Chitinophagaceae bacterium]
MSSPVLRDTLRLALTVAVVNGFASLTGLAFATYASMAVLSVTVGTYGNTLELGRQRLVGTAVGAIVVFFGYRAWGSLPVVVALPLALLLARLIAGSLRLTVGYTVCCFVVISGWLTHDQQLDSWIPLRLLWTAFGILMALLSLRLFWPSTARLQQRQGLLQLLVDLGHTLQESLDQASETERRRSLALRLRGLRQSLINLRNARVDALRELGALAAQHPVAQMWELLDHACESLMLDLDELNRLPEPQWQRWGLQDQKAAATAFSAAVAERLLAWQATLGRALELQAPPQPPLPRLLLETLRNDQANAAFQRLSPLQLQQVADRLVVLNRIEHTIASTERHWQALVR